MWVVLASMGCSIESTNEERGVVTDTRTPVTSPCEEGARWTAADVLSPSDGLRVSVSPWVPMQVGLPTGFGGAEVTTWLDCAEITAELGNLIRPRNPNDGGGFEYIGYLDLRSLEPGSHTLVHRFQTADDEVWRGSTFTYNPPEHTVSIDVRDSMGNPIHARVVVLKDGELLNLASSDGYAYDRAGRDSELHSFLVEDGVGKIYLEAGEYELIATRGPLDTIDRQTITVNSDASLNFVVQDAVNELGWATADFHMHTGASVDAYVPDHIRVHSLEASGLDAVVVTDHDIVRDLSEVVDGFLGKERTLQVIPGTEATLMVETPRDTAWIPVVGEDTGAERDSVGHVSVFPLDPRGSSVNSLMEEGLANHLDRFRNSQAEHPYNGIDHGVLQLNHPRGIQMRMELELLSIHDLFNQMGFDHSAPPGQQGNEWMSTLSKEGNRAFDFDAMEILNRGSWEAYQLVRADWFALLNFGWRVTGTGNSDSHAMSVEFAGYPMNLAPCPIPKPGETLQAQCWVDTVRKGRLVVSTGPLVNLVVQPQEGDATQVGATISRGKEPLEAMITVRAAPWVPVPEIRLIRNGRLEASFTVSEKDRDERGVLSVTHTVPLDGADRDTWVVAEAGFPIDQAFPDDPDAAFGVYATVVPGFVPVGFTNPVWIDENGDGDWRAGAAPQVEAKEPAKP